MSDLADRTRLLAESHGLTFRDCGSGHLQISGHGVMVNYWPYSRRMTAHCPDSGRRETFCEPWDAVRLCLTSAKGGLRPESVRKKKLPDNAPDVKEPTNTNPADIRHFYDGALAPWDERLGEFVMAASDLQRIEAHRLMCEADANDFLAGDRV